MDKNHKIINEELIQRLLSKEDGFTERKPEGAGARDFKETLVAFANSVPEDKTAILYIGVSNDGKPLGVQNPDSLQKTIRKICEKDCYPPIKFQSQVINSEGKDILAVTIPFSSNRPHFAGPGYIRRGSENVVVSEEMFQELIDSRTNKVAEILKWKNKIVTVAVQGKLLGSPLYPIDKQYRGIYKTHECEILECNSHYVKMKDFSGSYAQDVNEPLSYIKLNYDEKKGRLMLIVSPEVQ